MVNNEDLLRSYRYLPFLDLMFLHLLCFRLASLAAFLYFSVMGRKPSEI